MNMLQNTWVEGGEHRHRLCTKGMTNKIKKKQQEKAKGHDDNAYLKTNISAGQDNLQRRCCQVEEWRYKTTKYSPLAMT